MTYDVAIVGGGVLGWSAAWHLLRKEPALSVAVIDPHEELQSSLRASGGVRAQFSSLLNIELSRRSIAKFRDFREAVGTDPSFQQVGYLLVTGDPAKAQEMEHRVSIQKESGIAARKLTRDEVRVAAPYLHWRDICLATTCETDGVIDSNQVVKGYSRSATAKGASVITMAARVVASDRVELANGSVLSARQVLVTAGHWTAKLLELPIRPERHQVFLRSDAAGIPDDSPLVIDCDTSFYFRRRGAGLLVGYNDRGLALSPCDYDREPHFDVSVFFRMRPQVKHRCPVIFEGWSDISGWSGYYAATPDRMPVIGWHDGVFVLSGFGGSGIMHAPAAGEIAADLLLGRDPAIDLKEASPGRFESGGVAGETLVF